MSVCPPITRGSSSVTLPRAQRAFARRFLPLLSCALGLAAWPMESAQAATYYWDANGATAGSGTTPTGTWGTDAFFNATLDGTGTTFITSPLATDLARFTAGPTAGMTAYVVDVNGTQSIMGIVFRQTGTITLGATLNASTINLGSGGLDNGTRTIVSGNDSGGVIINSTLNLTADQAWVTNNVTSTTPPFTIAGNTTGTANLTLTNSSNRPFSVTGGLNYTGSLSITGGNGNGSVTISGNTGATGSIGSTVTGLTVNTSATNLNLLSRAAGNAYGGTTTVTAGKLLLSNTSGSATGTSAIALSGGSANASLGGSGTATGMLTVTAGSRVAPGTITNANNFGTAGTLTVGPATLTSANLDFDLTSTAAGTSDRLNVTGALTLGVVTFNIQSIGGTVSLDTTAPYTLITSTGVSNFAGATFNTTFNGALAGNYTAAYSVSGNNLQVTFSSAVPEPSTWALLAGGVVLLGVTARRQARRA